MFKAQITFSVSLKIQNKNGDRFQRQVSTAENCILGTLTLHG